MAKSIFISYRRSDSLKDARALYERLRRVLADWRVFIDLSDIPLGADFVVTLKRELAAARALVVLIGDGWVDATDHTGKRRLDDQEDFVRIELQTALARRIAVFPILSDGTPMPKADELPEGLRPLVRLQALHLDFRTFDSDVRQLERAIRKSNAPPKGAKNAAPPEKEAKNFGITEQILQFNSGRLPRLLELKYRIMRTSPYDFFRSTGHLFYKYGMPGGKAAADMPLSWMSGNVHIEGFVMYPGAKGHRLLDLPDFDYAALVPCTWALTQFVASVLIATPTVGISDGDAGAACKAFLQSYCAALADVERKHSKLVLIDGALAGIAPQDLRRPSLAQLLDRYTVQHRGRRLLRIDGHRALPTSPSKRNEVLSLLQKSALTKPPHSLRIVDIASRVAGSATLGARRYLVLAEATTSSSSGDEPILLDLKEALPSPIGPDASELQPDWRLEAERIVEVQRRSRMVRPRILETLVADRGSYVLRAIQADEERIAAHLLTATRPLSGFAKAMGTVVARTQARCAGWKGSSRLAEFSAFAGREKNILPIIESVRKDVVPSILAAYREFAEDFDEGKFQP